MSGKYGRNSVCFCGCGRKIKRCRVAKQSLEADAKDQFFAKPSKDELARYESRYSPRQTVVISDEEPVSEAVGDGS